MRLGLGLGVDSITSQKIGAGFTGLLDTYTGAVSAYSVRRLSGSYNGSSIKVRRSSDNTLQDIGFDANGDLDTTALLAFVNGEHTIADEDFSSSTGWTLAAGVTISGGVLSCLNSSANSAAYKSFGLFDRVGLKIRVSFTISNYSGSGTISFKKFGNPTFTETSSDSGTARSGNGTFTEELTFSGSTVGNVNWGLQTTGNFTGDVDDFEVVQITADGTVNILYDQMGNNDLSNGSASQQPQIVVGGSVTTKGGETAIKFNNLEYLQKTSASTSWVAETNVSIFSVFSCVDFAHVSEATKDTLYNISGDEIASGRGNSLVAASRSSQLRIGFYDEGASSYGQKQGFQSPTNDTQILVSSIYDSTTTITSILNASTAGIVISNPELSRDANKYTLGANHAGGKALDGTIQEFIIWNNDQTDNRDDIAGDMNTYFDIYS